MRKTLILCFIIPLLLIVTGAALAQDDPPPGIYDALADFNARTGNNFTILTTLDTWNWERFEYLDADPGCPGLFAGVISEPTQTYRYNLYFGGNVYIYYQPVGQTTRFCKGGTPESFIVRTTPVPVVCAIEPRLTIGGYAAVNLAQSDPINLRRQPNPEGDKLGEIPPGSIFKVVRGPSCGNDFTYWYVEYLGETGYAAEGTAGEYFVDPIWTPPPAPPAPDYSACVRPPRLTVTLQGRVVEGDPNRLRAAPDPDSELLGEIPGEEAFEVLEGPVCTPEYVYWRVSYEGLEGWTAEGDSDEYYVNPEGSLPTPPADYSYCPIQPRMTANAEVVVVGDGLNIRAEPHPNAEELGNLDEGDEVEVLEGPVCTLEFTYWSIELEDEVQGWIAEGSTAEYFLESTTPILATATAEAEAEATDEETPTATPTVIPGCSISQRLAVGEQGAVVGPPSNLREEPDPDSELLTTIPSGGEFEVLEGPECAFGHLYWQVNYEGTVGWTSEGQDGEYYVEPID